MEMFAQAVIGGVSQGVVYALIALGYSMIYSTLKMGHFAQGEFYMFGAYVGLTIATKLGMNSVIIFAGAALVTSIIMLIVERIAYKPMYGKPGMGLLIATIGMQFVMQEIVRNIWGSDQHMFPQIFSKDVIKLGNIIVSIQNLWILGFFAVLMVLLILFMKKTKTGIAMSAVSMNRRAASLMGVKTSTIIGVTYVMAACLAAIAGVMMGPIYNVSYTMGSMTGSKAMNAAVMGGFGSLPGAMLGGVLLGVIETVGALYLSTQYKDLFSFIVLIAVLFWRPQGILGQKKITKV
jgi:branched-chain amino acid transport system permease protein